MPYQSVALTNRARNRVVVWGPARRTRESCSQRAHQHVDSFSPATDFVRSGGAHATTLDRNRGQGRSQAVKIAEAAGLEPTMLSRQVNSLLPYH